MNRLTTTALAAALVGSAALTSGADRSGLEGGEAPKASAAAQPAASPCDTAQHHEFDFWVGEWQVFNSDTHELVGFDRVEKHSRGCTIQENLTRITDLYRRPGVAYRLEGIAINRFDGEAWLQMWADNQWGAIVMRGELDGKGDMVFKTIIPSRNRDLRLVYERHPDGTVRTLQYVAPAGSGKWEKFGDLLYRPNR